METVHICLAILAAVLMVAVQRSEAIDCYVCNTGDTYESEACVNPKGTDFVRNCDLEGIKDGLNYTMCRKMAQDVQGDFRIVRTCAATGVAGRCVERTGTTKIRVEYCECDGNKCNTASSLAFPLAALLLSSLVALKALTS